MKRTVIFLCLIALAISFLSAEYLVDSIPLLTPIEEESLEKALKNVSEKTGITTLIVIENESEYSSIRDSADMILETNEYGDDAIVFLLNMSRREYYISTEGEGAFIFDDSTLSDESLDGVIFPFLTDGDYYRAFLNWISYVDICCQYWNGEIVSSSSQEDVNADRTFDWGASLFFSLALALFISFFIVHSGKKKLKNVEAVNNADDFVVPSSFHVLVHKDIFLYSNVVRVRKANDDSSRRGNPHTTFHSSPSGGMHGGRGGRF